MSLTEAYSLLCYAFMAGLNAYLCCRRSFQTPIGVAALILQFALAPLFATIYLFVGFVVVFTYAVVMTAKVLIGGESS